MKPADGPVVACPDKKAVLLRVQVERTRHAHGEVRLRLSAALARIDQITGQHDPEGRVVLGPCSEYMRDELLGRMKGDLKRCRELLED